MAMIHTDYPFGSVNQNLVVYIIPLDSRGHYHLVDNNGNRYRISGYTYDYLLERGIRIYETIKSSNQKF